MPTPFDSGLLGTMEVKNRFVRSAIRSYTVAERLVEEGVADFISLSRPLIREPHLIARWKSGDREKSPCQSCNLCFKPIRDGKGMYCVVEAKEREKEAAGK